jgi:hypothetical protein
MASKLKQSSSPVSVEQAAVQLKLSADDTVRRLPAVRIVR